jgi:hypothetical protein
MGRADISRESTPGNERRFYDTAWGAEGRGGWLGGGFARRLKPRLSKQLSAFADTGFDAQAVVAIVMRSETRVGEGRQLVRLAAHIASGFKSRRR